MFFGPFFPFKLLVNGSKKNGTQHADELSSRNQGDVGPQITRQGQRRFKCRLEFDKRRKTQCENPDVVPYFHN